MKLLLDTHAVLWWVYDDPKLSRAAAQAIRADDNEVFVSAATAWEITTKFRLGKLSTFERIASDVGAEIVANGFGELPVTVRHGQRAGGLPGPLKDPFDRMLIAQAILEDLSLVSNEETFDTYGINRLW